MIRNKALIMEIPHRTLSDSVRYIYFFRYISPKQLVPQLHEIADEAFCILIRENFLRFFASERMLSSCFTLHPA